MSVVIHTTKRWNKRPRDTYSLRSNLNVSAFPSLCFGKLVRRWVDGRPLGLLAFRGFGRRRGSLPS
jgi:hypothetical protein